MKISIVAFTKQGGILAERIKGVLKQERIELCKRAGEEEKESLQSWAERQFQQKNAVVFIGACGIAVRTIAPFVRDKLTDSPVLVIDEAGEFVIPILSGHMGGANGMAVQIAEKIGAVPVITTATDIHQTFAVDMFAKKNRLTVFNREGIAVVSAKILEGGRATIAIEGNPAVEKRLPRELELVSYPPKEQTDIVISTENDKLPEAMLQLKPKEYVLGIGCRRGKDFAEISLFIQERLEKLGITEEDVAYIASVDQKKEEEGILQWSDMYRVPFLTFSEKRLKMIPGAFHGSSFVEQTIGVDNVCERAAMAACENGGTILLEKQAKHGMTLAAAKRIWNISWEVQDENI